MHRTLAISVLFLFPAVASANCPASMDSTTRLNCLNRALNAAATTIDTLQAANTELQTWALDAATRLAQAEDANTDLEMRLEAAESANDALEMRADGSDANMAALFTASSDADAAIGSLQSDASGLRADVDDVTATLATIGSVDVGDLFNYLTIDTATNSIIFSGANVYVRSGSGATDGAVNGLGNLIVGYGEDTTDFFGWPPLDRSGSHNLVVGMLQSYSSYGGLVAGSRNTISGPSASVTGGSDNTASEFASAVTGGTYNLASGEGASISGGSASVASGSAASVSGGYANTSGAFGGSILGGYQNVTIDGWFTTVAGGSNNSATENYSSVAGGFLNAANAEYSSVLGGYDEATTEYCEIYPEQ